MNFIDTHLLSLILFVPAIAAVIMLFLPNGENKLIRWFAFGGESYPVCAFAGRLVPLRREPARLPIRRILCLVRGDRFLLASWRGWPLAHDGPADHAADAACHPCIVQHHRPRQVVHDAVPLPRDRHARRLHGA